MGKIKIIDALDKKRLNSFISKCEARTISKIQHEIDELLFYWIGSPSIERLENIISSYSYLEEFIDFKIVKSRLKFLEQFEKEEAKIDIFSRFHLTKFLPELVVVRDFFTDSLVEYPQGIKKAELSLYPIALGAGADADMEAAIYFACRSELLLDAQEIKKEWQKAICIDIERGLPVGNLPDAVIDRAKSRTISLTEASEILKFNGDLNRFFCFMMKKKISLMLPSLEQLNGLVLKVLNPGWNLLLETCLKLANTVLIIFLLAGFYFFGVDLI